MLLLQKLLVGNAQEICREFKAVVSRQRFQFAAPAGKKLGICALVVPSHCPAPVPPAIRAIIVD